MSSEANAAVQTEIDQITTAHPVGSDGYRKPATQARLGELYAKMVGDEGGEAEPAVVEPLPPMPPAPGSTDAVTQRAADALQGLGEEGAALVDRWGGASNPNFAENLAYAKEAFADIVQTRPDLVERVEAAGLGDDPALIDFLAQHGRLKAGLMGIPTMTTDSNPQHRISPQQQGLKDELAQLMADNPPGSPQYKQERVQRRIKAINSALYGDGPMVGRGGRSA